MSKQDKEVVFPEKRFLGFSALEGWQLATIGQHLKESRTKGNKGDTAKKLTVKLWGNGVYEKNESLKGSPNTQYYRRKAGQFIYSKLDFLNQAFGIIPEHLDNYESTVDLPCFDVGSELDARFLLEYVQREDFYKTFGEIADGGRKAKRIQVDVFLNFPIYLPKFEEQQKIADCLSSVDELIAAEEQKLDYLKAHKKGLMNELFPISGETVPKRRFPEYRDSGEWIERRLEQAADYVNGKAHEQDIDEQGKYTVVNSKFISTEGKVKKYSNTASLLARKGDILMVLSDVPNGKALAKCFYVDKDDSYTVNQRICKLTATDAVSVLLFYSLDRNTYFLKFDDGVKQTNLRKDDVLNCPILLPKDKGEQQKIAKTLLTIDELITEQGQKIASLRTHKKGLMQQLFPSMEEVLL
ncbi:putative Type I site-specific deoxyribonuclease [Vibrio owensii]|uniref:restriction endonuclease subunit S n=1 Tax=Vibrio owensii TaxID=696485 RepID=UPI00289529FD|nr:putative Type I site-specific deoxyribonuclease [Vibrio owensii]CAH1565750.1 putative Type I site-specific deoxyribonuclease [Vibrio owensii]